MSELTLYVDSGNFRAFKILIAAEYNGIDIKVPAFKIGQDNKNATFLKKSPLGRVPLLETSSGCIFESNAIARYVAKSLVAAGLCHRVQVQLSYAIGLPDPLSVYIDTYGSAK